MSSLTRVFTGRDNARENLGGIVQVAGYKIIYGEHGMLNQQDPEIGSIFLIEK